MEVAYIGLGSNLGDREGNLREAAARIGATGGVEVRRESSLYFTEPVGVDAHPWYCNAVIEVETALTPGEMLSRLREIETAMGRKGKGNLAPRTIDLDILLFGNRVVNSNALAIPHPLLLMRRFALEPLAEIAPDLVHPGKGGTIASWLTRLGEEGAVSRKGPFYE